MLQFLDEDSSWVSPDPVRSRSYQCGYCDQRVGSDQGFRIDRRGDGQVGGIYLCPSCSGPTFFAPDGRQFPRASAGHTVEHVPRALNQLYEEARSAVSYQCYTGAVLLCQEILRHVAISRGADPEASFFDCVIYLDENGYLPPDGTHWVNHIGQQNRDTGRQIRVREAEDAEDLLRFTEMMLRFNYEFPSLIARSGSSSSSPMAASRSSGERSPSRGRSTSSLEEEENASPEAGSPSSVSEPSPSVSRSAENEPSDPDRRSDAPGRGNGETSTGPGRQIELGSGSDADATRRPADPSGSSR